jgi:hypothetical protein
MGLTKSRDASFYNTYIEEMIIIELAGERFAFRDVDAANAAFKALMGAMPLTYVYSEIDGVRYKLPRKTPNLALTRCDVLTEPDIDSLSLDGRTYKFVCDHNIIQHEGICGVAKCYESFVMDRSMYLEKEHPEGWFIFNPEDGCKDWSEYDLEIEEPTLHICCPQCAERIRDDHHTDNITRQDVWDARQFELDFIEKQKEES